MCSHICHTQTHTNIFLLQVPQICLVLIEHVARGVLKLSDIVQIVCVYLTTATSSISSTPVTAEQMGFSPGFKGHTVGIIAMRRRTMRSRKDNDELLEHMNAFHMQDEQPPEVRRAHLDGHLVRDGRQIQR